MFLDASAIIGILGREEDADLLLAKLKEATTEVVYSPISAYEAIIGLARKKSMETRETPIPQHLIEQVEGIVARFLAEVGARQVSIDGAIGSEAIGACKTFGRVVGHRARLNFGDCFAYACARSAGMPLLFKGDDFPHTDVEQA